ncbi:hypothetical protein [Epilithonimonas zeae]|uniref:hypothetical protein n=1 Tax=Epilithonimonas zeae TaxID=1416779 RepID=UPI00200F57AB|nr:hypothetical protein [Epilithonimonas zeae]UQB67651.1 hypothetical protein KI430_11460 [Epilithonimonas zeae]
MKKLLLILFVAVTTTVFSQKLKIESGNFDFLKDQTQVDVELKFDNVLILKEKLTEAQYLEKRKQDLLANPKRGNDGWKKWSGEWERYKSVYLDDFLKALKGSKKVEFKKDIEAKYTLVVDAKWISPGWHGGFVMQPAILSADIKFVETANPTVALLYISADEVVGKLPAGMSGDVMEYDRISAAYEKLGRLLLREINKGTK